MNRPYRPALTVAAVVGLLLPTVAATAGPVPSGDDGTRSVTGVLQVAIADERDGSTTPVVFAEVDGALIDVTDLVTADLSAPDPAATGDQVTVTLDTAGQAIAAEVEQVAASAPEHLAAAALTQAGSLTVLPVYWTTPDTQTPATLAALGNTTSAFWSAQSGGLVTTAVTSRPWAQIPAPSGCDAAGIRNAALAANPGLPNGPYDRILVYFPESGDCPWVGLGAVKGTSIWVNGYGFSDTFSHEYGHTLGFGHANTIACSTASVPVPWAGSGCTVTEYNDGDDVMGWAEYDDAGVLNTSLADQMGWVQTVAPSPSGAVTATLAPLSTYSGVRAVKIPFSGGFLYADYRPVADGRHSGRAGVQVHAVPNTDSYHDGDLLDMNTALPGYSDVAHTLYSMPPGTTYLVPGTNYVLAVLGVAGGSATVSVAPRSIDVVPPSAPVLTQPAGGWWASSATVTWTAASDAGVGLAGYTVTVNGRVRAVTPAGTTSATITVPASGTVAVTATDRAGNTATASLTRDVPPAPTLTAVRGDGQVTLTWPAVTANPTVTAYTVTVSPGGRTIPVGSGATTTTVTGLVNGTAYTFTATATNALGTSTASAAVHATPETNDPMKPQVTTAAGTHANPLYLTWTGPGAAGGATGYVVTVGGREHWLPASATSHRLTLDPGSYTVTVAAIDGSGTRRISNPVAVAVTNAPDPGFTDVTAVHPFYAAIAWMRAAGVTTGTTLTDGRLGYDGSGAVSRQAMAAFLYRLAGSPAYTPPATSPFADVRTGDPFYPEIAWLAQSGVSTGWAMPDGTVQYRPGEAVSREAMAAFLYRFAGRPAFAPPGASPFVDVSTGHPFYAAITWLAANGVSSGWAGVGGAEFRPGLSIERQAMAAFLYRLDKIS